MPIIHTVFERVCTTTPYLSSAKAFIYPSQCRGLTRVTTRPQIHRFRPQARAPPLGVCLPHQRCGDDEVSGSGVSVRACEGVRPRASHKVEWSTMAVPTYPEGMAATP